MYEKIQGLPISNAEFELLELCYKYLPEKAVMLEQLMCLVNTDAELRRNLSYISLEHAFKKKNITLSSLFLWHIGFVKDVLNVSPEYWSNMHDTLLTVSNTYRKWYHG